MGIIFGKRKPPSRVTQHDKAVLVSYRLYLHRSHNNFQLFQQLKQQRDKLKQYQRRIEIALNLDRELAKSLIAKGQKE